MRKKCGKKRAGAKVKGSKKVIGSRRRRKITLIADGPSKRRIVTPKPEVKTPEEAAKQRLPQVEEQIAKLGKAVEELEKQIKKKESEIKKIEEDSAKRTSELEQISINIKNLEEYQKNNPEELKNVKAKLKLWDEIAENQVVAEEIKSNLDVLSKSKQEATKALEGLRAKLADVNKQLAELTDEYGKLLAVIEEEKTKAKEAEATKEKVSEALFGLIAPKTEAKETGVTKETVPSVGFVGLNIAPKTEAKETGVTKETVPSVGFVSLSLAIAQKGVTTAEPDLPPFPPPPEYFKTHFAAFDLREEEKKAPVLSDERMAAFKQIVSDLKTLADKFVSDYPSKEQVVKDHSRYNYAAGTVIDDTIKEVKNLASHLDNDLTAMNVASAATHVSHVNTLISVFKTYVNSEQLASEYLKKFEAYEGDLSKLSKEVESGSV